MTEAAKLNFGLCQNRPEASLPSLDKWDVGVLVRAYAISETGRPNKCLIPPQGTRLIPTGLKVEVESGFMLVAMTPIDLALKSIFVVPRFLNLDQEEELLILIHNGSHQSWYISHEDPIARLSLVPVVYAKVGEMTL